MYMHGKLHTYVCTYTQHINMHVRMYSCMHIRGNGYVHLKLTGLHLAEFFMSLLQNVYVTYGWISPFVTSITILTFLAQLSFNLAQISISFLGKLVLPAAKGLLRHTFYAYGHEDHDATRDIPPSFSACAFSVGWTGLDSHWLSLSRT